jgi:hypothetical protein
VPARIGPAWSGWSGPGGIVSFRADDPSRSVDQINAGLPRRHERAPGPTGAAAPRGARSLCTTCHVVMRNVTPKFQLAKLTEMDTLLPVSQDKRPRCGAHRTCRFAGR